MGKFMKRIQILAAALLLAALAVVSATAGATGQRVIIIGHRGDSAHAPENTLASFRKAAEGGADFFELDCQLTKDNQVVISHDGDLERTAGVKKAIADLTLAEIQAFEVGGWFAPEFKGEKMPTFVQALETATDHCGVYVEIKAQRGDGAASRTLVQHAQGQEKLTDDLRAELVKLASDAKTASVALTRACIAEIRAHKMEKRVVIQSFSPLICFVALQEAPEIRTELLISDDKDDPAHFQRFADFGMLIGVQGFNASKDSLTPERLAAFHAAKKTVAVWTVNEKEEWRRFAAMGVDAVITNFPRECREDLAAAR